MIYISGPISGTGDYLERFDQAEYEINKNLNLRYDHIINPANVLDQLPIYELDYSDVMKLCLDLLSMCDSIYMLHGWERSKGAKLEYQYAVTNDYKIFFQK